MRRLLGRLLCLVAGHDWDTFPGLGPRLTGAGWELFRPGIYDILCRRCGMKGYFSKTNTT